MKPPMSKRQIQARLVERGSSFRNFALTHGYEPRTVTQTVARWAGRDSLPNGRVSYRIMRDLSEAIGEEVLPGILDARYAPFAASPGNCDLKDEAAAKRTRDGVRPMRG